MTREKVKNFRDSRFEMLRIIAMLMIIGHHYCVHGLLQVTSEKPYEIWQSGSLSHQILGLLFYPGGEVGVAIFFIITGYFLIIKPSTGYKRVICETIFYSWLSLLVMAIFQLKNIPLNVSSSTKLTYIWKSFLVPITGGQVWFVTFYIALLLFSPVINKLLSSFNKKQYLVFLTVSWIFWYSIASMGSTLFGVQKAIFFYSIGAYIRRFYENKKYMSYICSGGAAASWICGIAIAYKIVSSAITNNIISNKLYETALTAIIVPICSLSIFLLFINIRPWHNTKINTISKTTFGIYLMHDIVIFRNILWSSILKVPDLQYFSPYFGLMMLGSIILVFLAFSLIDELRIYFIENKMLIWFDKILSGFCKIS